VTALLHLVDATDGGKRQLGPLPWRAYRGHVVHSAVDMRMVLVVGHGDSDRRAVVIDLIKWLSSYDELRELLSAYGCQCSPGTTSHDIAVDGIVEAIDEVEQALRREHDWDALPPKEGAAWT
jgi:hypothetical protein